MALSPDRHTLLTMAAGVVIGIPAAGGGLASRYLAGAGQEHLAHDHVVDLVRPSGRSLECGPDGEGAQLGGGEGPQRARQLPDRGAGPGNDDRTWHAQILRSAGTGRRPADRDRPTAAPSAACVRPATARPARAMLHAARS